MITGLQMGTVICVLYFLAASLAVAEEPSVSYIFPAGGQRGTTVQFKVGGHYLHGDAGFEMIGPGVVASPRVHEAETVWFEGPLIPLPASQNVEDYPRDYAGQVTISGDAPLGIRHWRVWTSQGATGARKFIIGDLPEVVEEEIDGDPIPVRVELPVTINGRTFPREDMDVWTFTARAGERITCDVAAKRIGSPVDARLELLDPHGRRLAEATGRSGSDPRLHFTAPRDGVYQVRIHDLDFGGVQHYVYRLTITAGPSIDFVYPLGGRRGQKTQLQLTGQSLPSESAAIDLPPDGPKTYAALLNLGGPGLNAVLLDLDDFPERLEAEPNNERSALQPIRPPVVLNGRINPAGDVDYWKLDAKKDETFDLDLKASRLDTPLDSVLIVLDSANKELARNDDLSGEQTDSRLQFKAPADGAYFIRVQERFAARGGPEFGYRLRVAPPPPPDLELVLSGDSVSVVRDVAGLTEAEKKKRPQPKPAKLRVDANRSGGFAGAIELSVDGLPEGVSVQGAKIAEKQPRTELIFTAAANTRIQTKHVTIRGTAKLPDGAATRVAQFPGARGEPSLDQVLLAVAMPTPFKAYGDYLFAYGTRGSIYRRRYHLDRGGFAGPLQARLADRQVRHLQGLQGPTLAVPSDANEFEYPLSLPPGMEIGRTSRSAVMVEGTIKDFDGSEHIVSFSSGEQNDQIIAVVEPGKLSIASDRKSLLAQPNTTATVHLQIQRDPSLAQAAVRIELKLPRHFHDVSAEPVTLPARSDTATLGVHFGARPGPFNMPALIRATTIDPQNPFTAETSVEFVAESRSAKAHRP